MRDLGIASAVLLALACGCGDGIGQPIVVNEAASGTGNGFAGAAAGVGGTTENTAGTGGSDSSGSAGTSSSAGNSGSSSAGQAGTSNLTGGTGGREGFAGMDFGPPWDEEAGGRGGPDGPDGPDRGNDSPGDPMEAVPTGSHCESVVEWDPAAAEAEQELFDFLYFAREAELGCASEASGRLPQLRMSPELRCAARLHSRDMSENDFFDHVNEQGEDPEARMLLAGATFEVAGESIADESESPEDDSGPRYQAVADLFAEGASGCRSLMDSRFDAVGIGFFQGLWTLDFTGP